MAPPKLGKGDRDALRAFLQQHGANANTMRAGMNALNIPWALRKSSEAQVAWVIAHPAPAPAQAAKSASPEPGATSGVAGWQNIAGMIGDLRETIASDRDPHYHRTMVPTRLRRPLGEAFLLKMVPVRRIGVRRKMKSDVQNDSESLSASPLLT
ncbi:hypothetical protein LTR97_007373 [Elasticomyces elasticus]|uniref:Uncharacterized protein n=1 Tax=Elasticomyces elasticus TaxID=574655 RepID=A0AAN7ZTB4_9PEZI|nr:hypothetical protein LTR97_007373 [Elasticomyces elasticus]